MRGVASDGNDDRIRVRNAGRTGRIEWSATSIETIETLDFAPEKAN